MTHPLIDQLADLLGPSVAVAAPEAGEHRLWPHEAATIAQAIPNRQAEFAAGRSAARAALGLLGHSPIAIPSGPDRAPIWPTGVTGSITHTKGLCLAAVAQEQHIAALGIDAECAAPLETNVLQTILTEDEQRELSSLPALSATAVFSAKEAVYKAFSPFLDEIWGFDAMTIRLDPPANRFHAHLLRHTGSLNCGQRQTGLLLQDQDHILTAFALPNQA